MKQWEVLRLFCRAFCGEHKERGPVAQWRLGFRGATVQFEGEFKMNMKDNASPVAVHIKWLDALGKTVPFQPGSETLVSDNPDAVAVTGDAASGFKVGPGPNQSTPDSDPVTGAIATVTLTAAGLETDGVTPLSAVGSIVLLAGDAATGTVTFGDPPQP